MEITKASLPEWHAGNGTVQQTPVQLPQLVARSHIVIRAHKDNDAEISIGPTAGAAAGGFTLAAGESQSIPVNDASKVFVVAASGTQAYSWLAI